MELVAARDISFFSLFFSIITSIYSATNQFQYSQHSMGIKFNINLDFFN